LFKRTSESQSDPSSCRILKGGFRFVAELSLLEASILDPRSKLLDEIEKLAATLRETREKFERKYLISVLTTVKGNVSWAAELAGKDQAEFYRLLRKHTLLPTAFKATA
jgi:transcriptional regulator of acetoin/glycerol metabolism